jgi:hypothetical protein
MLIITTRKQENPVPSNGAYKIAIERRLGSYPAEVAEEDE